MPTVARPGGQGLNYVEIPFREDTARPITPSLQPGTRRWWLTPGVLAGQQPAGQGEIGKVGHAQAQTEGDDLQLVGSVQQVVVILNGHEARPAGSHCVLGFAEHLGGEVRATDLSDLAFVD